MSPLSALDDHALARVVGEALQQYESLVALAYSPLAERRLIDPALVLDEVAPTIDERGRAVRLVLRWAVERLAPGPPPHSLGEERPLDDPTWRDPLWWGYNILRHRYLEPLHPDLFVEGGRYTETLLAVTGIPGEAAYYQERTRAIREVAHLLRRQWRDGRADDALRRQALAEVTAGLGPAATTALAAAAAFRGVFAREWLLRLLRQERHREPEAALHELLERRLLRTNRAGDELWLSPALRAYVYAQHPPAARRRRHRFVAPLYDERDDRLEAAWHWQQAGEHERAAQRLLAVSPAPATALDTEAMRELLAALQPAQVPAGVWLEAQLALADLHAQAGALGQAQGVCRRALVVADADDARGRIYRRLGKLYEAHNQREALRYYREATGLLPPDHPETVLLLKDLGWFHLLRQEWEEAEGRLQAALAEAEETAGAVRADIYDALSVLHTGQERHEEALRYERQALALGEQQGDLWRVARSLHNIALTHNAMGQYVEAVAAFHQALPAFKRMGNRREIVVCLLNMGMSNHLRGELAEAVRLYEDSLALCRTVELPLVEVKLHSNLAEALAELGHREAANHHWELGYRLAQQQGFGDQITYYQELAQQFPALGPVEAADEEDAAPAPIADPAARTALALARREGRVTAGTLMEQTGVSKSTATRRLAELVEQGLLLARGRGRGAHYTPVERPQRLEREAAIREILLQVLPRLQADYGVERFGLVSGGAGEPVQIAVHFREMPDLVAFFEMRAQLDKALPEGVEVVPAAALPPAVTVEWIGAE